MGKRGPKPVNMGLLNVWEFEWWKAFHLLRDGTQLPGRVMPALGLTLKELRKFILQLKEMSPGEYWRATRRVEQRLASLSGKKVDLSLPTGELFQVQMEWAKQEQAREIFDLERALNPRKIQAEAERREIWKALIQARTHTALMKACEDWDRLPDVRAAGMQCFPAHVTANEKQLFFMKRNNRFPRSDYGDNSRLDYLARGMAGVMVGLSPMTAIERLRNMKHESGGPFWKEREHFAEGKFIEARCDCWRCGLEKGRALNQMAATWQSNGLRLFMEIADRRREK